MKNQLLRSVLLRGAMATKQLFLGLLRFARKDTLFNVFVLVFAVIFFAAVPVVCATPPSDIKITFDLSTKILRAVIIHNTSNPVKHYISKVDVGLNGREIIGHQISRQDNNESQTVSYLVSDVKAGDVFLVEGYCSISGKFKKEIKVE